HLVSSSCDCWEAREVPTRLCVRVSRDTFTGRTHAGFWGNTETGDSWGHDGFSDSYAVNTGVGKHTVSAVSSYALSFLGDSYADCQVAASCTWSMDVAGGSIEPCNLMLRYQASGALAGEAYLLRAVVSTAEVLTVAIWNSALGALTSPVTIGTLTPGFNGFRAKFQIEGQTLRGKVYAGGPAGDPDQFEPNLWHVTAHDERLTTG